MFHEEAIESKTLELLIKLQHLSALEGFYLAGGTSLAMQIGHRKSIDLDLFSQNGFAANSLLEFLEESFSFKLIYSAKNTLNGCIGNVNIDVHDWPSMIKERDLSLNKVKKTISASVKEFSKSLF